MSEFAAVMDGGGGHGKTTGHNFSRVLSGDMESVRERLVYALGRLDYRVLSQQPLIAKRSDQSHCSFDVRKCVKSLSIVLRPLNPTSTLVTFDYEIVNPMVTKGDRQTLEREAEALMALATAHQLASVCPFCGAASSSDSRFCRVCGHQNNFGELAEMEVLRLTAGARPAHQSITGALILALAIAAIALPLILLRSKGPTPGWIFLIIGETLAFVWLLTGMWKLHRTLNPTKDAPQTLPANLPRSIPSFQTAALPPQSARASVTEGTTELFAAPERERVAVPVKSQKVDTAEMG